MRKLFLTSAAVLAFSAGAAFASDLPTHKGPPPAPIAPPFSWTGFSIGIEGGFGSGGENDNLSSVPLPTVPTGDSFGVSGPIGGIDAGYDQQFNSFVIGVVADIEASDIHGGTSFNVTPCSGGPCVGSLSMHNTWQSSLRARAGVAFDRLLIYGTGGLAIADDQENSYYNHSGTTWLGSQTDTLYGWTVGVGAEYAITDHWTTSAELRYASFSDGNYSITRQPSGPTHNYKAGFDETLMQIGLGYKF
jgi:outer membrane immunogenic protein